MLVTDPGPWDVTLETLCGCYGKTEIPDGKLTCYIERYGRMGTRTFEIVDFDVFARTAKYQEICATSKNPSPSPSVLE